jgi:GNAT superfamily N-acetyltransferase
MANAKIISVELTDLDLIADLYSQVYSPPQHEEFFRRRFEGRRAYCVLVAMLDERPVGFAVGYELKPFCFYCWACGVIPDARRLGVATQLIQALEAFAVDHEYTVMRFECQNQHRAMLHLAITENYDLVGIRWDSNSAANMAIFEKELHSS